jgi:TolA-binding protein
MPRFTGVCIALAALAGCSGSERPAAPPATTASPAQAPPTERVVGPLSEADAQALATMNDRVRDYILMHRKLEGSLPKVPQEATPEQIDRNQRALEVLVRKERAAARPGDIFTAEARPVIKRLLATVFAGPEGRQLKASIMDENVVDPVQLKVRVNARYPDSVPLTSIPPEVLQTLPKLGEDLEYRFIGDWLILLDTHAHLIADYIEDVLPKS